MPDGVPIGNGVGEPSPTPTPTPASPSDAETVESTSLSGPVVLSPVAEAVPAPDEASGPLVEPAPSGQGHASRPPGVSVTPEVSPSTPDNVPAIADAQTPTRERQQQGYSAATPSSSQGNSSASLNNSMSSRKETYEFLNVLGYGSYSRVVLAVHKTTRQEYAVKVVSKVQIQVFFVLC